MSVSDPYRQVPTLTAPSIRTHGGTTFQPSFFPRLQYGTVRVLSRGLGTLGRPLGKPPVRGLSRTSKAAAVSERGEGREPREASPVPATPYAVWA